MDGHSTHLPVVLDRKVKREPSNPLGLRPRRDLQALHDTRVTLVLETAVLALGVFTDDGKVDVLVAGWNAGEGLADHDGSVDVESLTHGDVP